MLYRLSIILDNNFFIDLDDGIDTISGKMTVCQLYDKKNSQRKNIKRNGQAGKTTV